MVRGSLSFIKRRADSPRLLSFGRRSVEEKEKAEVAGREYDRVLLISMANARFRRYVLMDEFVWTNRSRAA
ncbi:MAG: hypothetical protein ABSG55_00295 [Dehalococcoidia bacterium]|jgi:hypothetical protein